MPQLDEINYSELRRLIMVRPAQLGFVPAKSFIHALGDSVQDPDRVAEVAEEAARLVFEVAVRRGRSGVDHVQLLLESAAEASSEPLTAAGTLTVGERTQLLESGAFSEEELAETETQIADGALDRLIAKTRQDAIADSFGAQDLEGLLGRSTSRISHRATAEKSLYSFRVGRSRRFPKWQFTATGEIPGLAEIVPAIPETAHPVSVNGFMRNPSPALVVEGGKEQSPIEWLLNGGDVRAVVQILREWPMK